jgi:serine/threonine protein phosphatase PrpC
MQSIQWKCSGASVRGHSHETNGTECQDTWTKYATQDALAVCVCDGAGSAVHSRIGAEITSKIVTQWLAEFFDDAFTAPLDVFQSVHSDILDALRKTADDLACEIGDLSCTLVAVAVDSAGRYVHWHLGDGGIIVRFDNELMVLSAPQKGEYANETFFVTENDAAEHLQFGASTKEIEDVTGFAVFSDGLEGLLYCHTTLAVAPAITGMLDWHKQADEDAVSRALEKNLTEVFRTKTNDDCSLVLLTANRRDNGTIMDTHPS